MNIHGNLWQSSAWKCYQEALGREVRIYEEADAYALVVIDRTVGGFSVWEIPRGPLLVARDSLLVETFMQKIIEDAKKDRCISLYFSPEQEVVTRNAQRVTRNVQPVATRIIDLTLSEEELLKQMKPKGRYNIRVAEKQGVTVKESDDIDAFYALLQQTGGRDGFTIKPKREYEIFLEKLPGSFLLLAESCKLKAVNIAGLIGVIHGTQSYYYYGASSYEHRALMAPYLLQWTAIQKCKATGCTSYDLFGIAPPDALNHPWSPVSQFKEKFGGEVITYPEEQEIILKPVIKRLLEWKRKVI